MDLEIVQRLVVLQSHKVSDLLDKRFNTVIVCGILFVPSRKVVKTEHGFFRKSGRFVFFGVDRHLNQVVTVCFPLIILGDREPIQSHAISWVVDPSIVVVIPDLNGHDSRN